MAITNSFYGYIMMLFAITIVVCVESQLQTFYNAIVSKDGTGNFNTIVGAILAAPDHSVKPFFIKIKKDTYEEYIRVEKKKINIVLIGEGMDNTIITGNRSFVDGNKTYDTATVGGSANESSQVSGALAIAEVEVLTPKMSFASKYLSANVASSIALS
ncbi:pectinesterase/pectinesterase inhibitor PPE8B-like [Solanum lycopersicum]|uniref:pectinesterase/pectinesterase inhibitor PPE8B-like n=1 Tax=Solanum lycopersicum TaxID=4081 RepID=UPI000532A6AE|nr:pectinesterase/pectinesterase inhibitor PPE8B-like [Solanum lycopersicum]